MKKATILLVFLTLLFALHAEAGQNRGNGSIQSFSKAKKILFGKVYHDHRLTFYCACTFNENGAVDHSNGYRPAKLPKRAQKIEWEHIVPAEAFGRSFNEWRYGHPDCIRHGISFKGRKCAGQVSLAYRSMQADLYNLVPAVGEINGLRSNYAYGMIPGEKREFGTCDMEIERKTAEPRPGIRGDIARTYFYMDFAYPGYGIIDQKKIKNSSMNGMLPTLWMHGNAFDAGA